MNEAQNFEQRANEARAAIGKPPVSEYDDIPVYTDIWSTFMRAVEHDRMFHRYIGDLAEIGRS